MPALVMLLYVDTGVVLPEVVAVPRGCKDQQLDELGSETLCDARWWRGRIC